MIPILWTVLVVVSFIWNSNHINKSVKQLARVAALARIEKDLLYRQWASLHGGVYVPITSNTPPNPYLNVPQRDITTDRKSVV
jgi:hypothetical protein